LRAGIPFLAGFSRHDYTGITPRVRSRAAQKKPGGGSASPRLNLPRAIVAQDASPVGKIEHHNSRDMLLRVTRWFPASTFGVPPICRSSSADGLHSRFLPKPPRVAGFPEVVHVKRLAGVIAAAGLLFE
jgi:hypothetical protein